LLLAVPGYRELCDADPGEESEAVKRARAERQVVGFKSLRRASMRKPGARTERGTGGGDGDSNGKRCKTDGKTGFNRDEEKQSSGRGGFDGDEEDDIEGRQGRDDMRECSGRDTGDRRSMHSKSSIANRAAKEQEHHDKEDHSEN
jgi:TATA-binding protein-associated factor Taf7